MKRIIPVLVVSVIMFTIFVEFVYSQNQLGSGTFNKKSISILPITSPSASSYHNQMKQAIVYMDKSAQFDYNYIREDYINSFQSLISKSNIKFSSPESSDNMVILSKLLKETGIIKEIIEIATNTDTLIKRYRNSLKTEQVTALSKQEISLSVEDWEKLVGGIYVGIPIYTGMNDKKEATGVLFWLKIVKPYDGYKFTEEKSSKDSNIIIKKLDPSNIILQKVLVKKLELTPGSDLSGFDTRGRMNIELEKSLTPQEAGARIITRSILSIAEQTEDFKQRGTIQDLEDGPRVDLGKKEGLKLDQGFKVFENTVDNNGKTKFVYKGFIRVDNVADNTNKIDAKSSFYTIIPGSFERGYSVVAHPQFMDISLKAGYKSVNIPKEMFSDLFTLGNIYKEDVTNTLAAELSASFNLAQLVHIHQLFFGASGSYGLPLTKSTSSYTFTPSIIDVEVFLLKKFWFQRFNFSLAAFGGTSIFSISGNSDVGEVKIKTDGLTYSVGGRASLEFAISPDLNLALDAGYKYVLSPTAFKLTIAGTDYTFDKVTNSTTWNSWKMNDLRLGGLNFGLRFTYSIPKL
ncbi:MAG: hypothetical protein ACOYN6_03095 [Ignavibacteria bacterium]